MEKAMGKKETVAKKRAPGKLKLKKETVKDLSVKDGAAQAVKGAAIPCYTSRLSFPIVCW
jgi:hypothetical protein